MNNANKGEVRAYLWMGVFFLLSVILWRYGRREVLLLLAVFFCIAIGVFSVAKLVIGCFWCKKFKKIWALCVVLSVLVAFGIRIDISAASRLAEHELSKGELYFSRCCNVSVCELPAHGWTYVGNGMYVKKVLSPRVMTKLVYSPKGESGWRVHGSMLIVDVAPLYGECEVE